MLVTRYAGQIYAIGDTCTHMGCSLSDGKLQGDEVMCPCHNSHFRITDGQVVKGPATVAEPAYESRVRDGRILLRPRATAFRSAAKPVAPSATPVLRWPWTRAATEAP